MDKKTFIETIKEKVDKLGKIVVEEIVKPDERYTGLYIKKASGIPTAVVNMDEVYKEYENGMPLMECLDFVRHLLTTAPPPDIDTSFITDWNKAKKRLIVRVFDEKPAGLFDEFNGSYFCPYVEVSEYGGVRVTDRLLELWGVSFRKVCEIAATNMAIKIARMNYDEE